MGDDGAWIGIDVGTTNCAVAVYDRTRGGCKWIRLSSDIALLEVGNNGKLGRIVPSVLLFATHSFISSSNSNNKTSNDRTWKNVNHLLIETNNRKQLFHPAI